MVCSPRNSVTPKVFARYPSVKQLAAAAASELEALIRPTGFYRSKARSLLGMARAVVERVLKEELSKG